MNCPPSIVHRPTCASNGTGGGRGGARGIPGCLYGDGFRRREQRVANPPLPDSAEKGENPAKSERTEQQSGKKGSGQGCSGYFFAFLLPLLPRWRRAGSLFGW